MVKKRDAALEKVDEELNGLKQLVSVTYLSRAFTMDSVKTFFQYRIAVHQRRDALRTLQRKVEKDLGVRI